MLRVSGNQPASHLPQKSTTLCQEIRKPTLCGFHGNRSIQKETWKVAILQRERERGRGKERKKEKERGREAKVEAYLEAGTQAMVRSEFHLSQVLAWRAEPSIQRWLLLLEGQPILWLPWSFTQAIYAS